MSLDLRNFVNVNINYNLIDAVAFPQGIATLITKNTAFTDNTPGATDLNIFKNSGPYADGIFYSESDFQLAKKELSITNTSLDKYVKAFFENKGRGLQIIGGCQNSGTSSAIQEFLLSVLEKLNYRFVIITSDADEEDLRKVALSGAVTEVVTNPLTGEGSVSTFTGLNEKFFISSVSDTSGKLFNHLSGSSAPTYVANKYYKKEAGEYVLLTSGSAPADWDSGYTNYYEEAEVTRDLDNYVIKFGEKGIEMLAAAYLSKARMDAANNINDYAFTIEKCADTIFTNSVVTDNSLGVKFVESHFNFDTNLVNAIRNYPGDTVTGIDMMNYYVKILLTQDLSEAVMDLLASKIKFNQAGLNRLNNVISQQMNQYIQNGYLNTDYIYTGDDIYYTFNGVQYLVCEKNTPLTKGYKCAILPLTALSREQAEAHALPPVYLLLADQTGIRSIVINGDIY